MHLAVYTDAPRYAGAEESLGNLLAELPSHYRVTVLGTERAVLDAVARRRAGSEVVVLAPVPRKRHLRAVLAHIRAVGRLRPDVLHANLWTPWSCQYGILAALLTPGVRTVAVEQLPLPSRSASQRWLKARVSRRLSAHVAVGDRAARLIEEMAGLEPNSVRTVYNGVPEHVDGPPPALRERPVIGSLGRLHEQKGYDVLVRALTELPDARAVIVGDGPERPALEARARALGVADRLELVGWRDDARAWLAAFDIFVLPSRYEGFPLSIVEAMLAGTPVVATDVASVPEAVLHRRTGLLVPPDDPAALASAIGELLRDADLGRALASAARERALERFTSAAMAREYMEIYAEITAAERDAVQAGSPTPQL
jgi:glycosyltransferase involved in cell wall biosynthesis